MMTSFIIVFLQSSTAICLFQFLCRGRINCVSSYEQSVICVRVGDIVEMSMERVFDMPCFYGYSILLNARYFEWYRRLA